MQTLARKKIKSTNKIPEVTRLIEFLNLKSWNAADLAASINTAERTITNCLWNNKPIGGQLLRELLEVHNVSANWLLSGVGTMFVSNINSSVEDNHAIYVENKNKPLMPYHENTDLENLQDFWWLTAKAAEQSLLQAGAEPGEDYNRLDLYQLVLPLVTEKFKNENISITAFPD